MTLLVVSRQVETASDRSDFTFAGIPSECDRVSAVADAQGWNVTDSGATKIGAWINVSKFNDTASPFPELYRALAQANVAGRLAPEVAN